MEHCPGIGCWLDSRILRHMANMAGVFRAMGNQRSLALLQVRALLTIIIMVWFIYHVSVLGR